MVPAEPTDLGASPEQRLSRVHGPLRESNSDGREGSEKPWVPGSAYLGVGRD